MKSYTYACILTWAAVLIGISCSSNKNSDIEVLELQPLSAELQLILNDMNQPHQGIPSGVKDASGWKNGPRISYGNNPPSGWTAALPWGQVYTDEIGNTAVNTRFQIRNIKLWYLSKTTNAWKEWSSSSNLTGANYAEDFQNDINIDANIRDETGNGGGISSTLVEGYNFHFWNGDGRTVIYPDDIAGVWASVESRLIIDDPTKTDDRNTARMMMGAGADYWESLTAQWDQFKTNGDIFIGRFRYLTSEWQTFHGHTLTEKQLQENPPPLN